MAFERRLVAVDLDKTLILTSELKFEDSDAQYVEVLFSEGPYYVYIRPYAATALLRLSNDPRNVLVLFSAGSSAYVNCVLELVLYPAIRIVEPNWQFSCVFANHDLVDGHKPIGNICKRMGLASSILIDDMVDYCLGSGADAYYLIDAFDPTEPEDTELLILLQSDIFKPQPLFEAVPLESFGPFATDGQTDVTLTGDELD